MRNKEIKTSFVGRRSEQTKLKQAIQATIQGKGKLILVAGEAGVGKTRLVDNSLTQCDLLTLTAQVTERQNLAYAPLVAILRTYLRQYPAGLADIGALTPYLAILLPELGQKATESDQPTLFEALIASLQVIAQAQPTAIVLDDLQWADSGTLEFLLSLALILKSLPLLVIGIYRDDQIPRDHSLRRLRIELRRQRLFHEMTLSPFKLNGVTALANQLLDSPLNPSLVAKLYEHTQGIPLFVEELVVALHELGQLQEGTNGLELVSETALPIPQTIRDAVSLRLDNLSAPARKFLETAASIGMNVDLDMVIYLLGDDAGLEEIIHYGFIHETGQGRAEFRHALTREAIYKEIIWTRRRKLHHHIAVKMEADGGPPQLVAEHWLKAKDFHKAHLALKVAAQQSCRLHAYRDAADNAERALEIWPANSNETERLEMLDMLGYCAQLNGQLSDTIRAWRELAEGQHSLGNEAAFAETQRRLAGVYQLQGMWRQAMSARQTAVSAFLACHLMAEAATEHLAMASHMQAAGQMELAVELAEMAWREAGESGRFDLIARSLGIKGLALGKLGRIDEGLTTAQQGLSLALEHNLTGPASEIYFRYASILEQSANYHAAQEAYLSAVDYCQIHGQRTMEQVCLACVAGIFWHTGDWQRAMSICRDVLTSEDAPVTIHAVAAGYLGSIHAYRGETKRARKLLKKAAAQAKHGQVIALEFICVWGLAMCADLDGDGETAVEYCNYILENLANNDERHFVIPILRWAATFLGGQQAQTNVQACAKALANIAASTGNPEALAALAHSLGEDALLNDQPQQAAKQFQHSYDLLKHIESPIQHAETQFRAGVAFVAAGEREKGVQHLVDAHHTARKLTARPLAKRIAQQLELMGESLQKRLGRGAAASGNRGGLTRRQLEVMQLIAGGQSNQEIAQQLILSVRTIDMHVSNILARLDCRTRTEAVHIAGDLGLL